MSDTIPAVPSRALHPFFTASYFAELKETGTHSLAKGDFAIVPATIWKAARETGLEELAVTAEHAVKVDALPRLHRDPFDRLLVAQAQVAGMKLLSSDSMVNAYFAGIKRRR